MHISVDQEKCIACGTCAAACPECFEIKEGGKSHPKKENCDCPKCDLKEIAANCPAEAITVADEPAEK